MIRDNMCFDNLRKRGREKLGVGCDLGVPLEVVFHRLIIFVLLIMFCDNCYYSIKVHLRMRYNILHTK
jgi:hypothetical protein